MKHIPTLLLAALAVSTAWGQQDTRPDIVLLLADDVSPQYIYKGDTPNLKALAAQGVLFRRGSAWATAICAPTRHALMTGCFADETGVRHNALATTPGKPGIEDYLTIPKIMKEAGYSTHFFGKWGVNGQVSGYDSGLLWAWQLRSAGMEDSRTGSRSWWPAITDLEGEAIPTSPLDFGPDVFTDAVIDALQDGPNPKFIFFSMVDPHGIRGHDYPKAPGTNGKSRKARYRKLIAHMDSNIGRIIAAKKRPTIFFFIGDNPTAKEGKQEGIERGCEVPVIIGGDGIYPRGSERSFFSIVDFLPTAAAFAEYGEPIRGDGISIKSYLVGETHITRNKMFSNIGGTQLAKKGKYTIQSRDKVRRNPSGDFYRGKRLLRRKGRVYHQLRRYSTQTGGRLPARGSKIFRGSNDSSGSGSRLAGTKVEKVISK